MYSLSISTQISENFSINYLVKMMQKLCTEPFHQYWDFSLEVNKLREAVVSKPGQFQSSVNLVFWNRMVSYWIKKASIMLKSSFYGKRKWYFYYFPVFSPMFAQVPDEPDPFKHTRIVFSLTTAHSPIIAYPYRKSWMMSAINAHPLFRLRKKLEYKTNQKIGA